LTIHNCLSTSVIKEKWATLTIRIFNRINASGFSLLQVLFVQVLMFVQHLMNNCYLQARYAEREEEGGLDFDGACEDDGVP
jgi:hypothetical protein